MRVWFSPAAARSSSARGEWDVDISDPTHILNLKWKTTGKIKVLIPRVAQHGKKSSSEHDWLRKEGFGTVM